MDERAAYEVAKGGIEDEHYKSNYNRGILGLGLYGGIEQAEGWQILINMILTLTTGITIWMLGRVKEVISHDTKKRKSNGLTNKIFKVH